MKCFKYCAVTFVLSVLITSAHADKNKLLPPSELIALIQQGGYIIYFRHAPTVRKSTDTNAITVSKNTFVDYSDCSVQRNLSDEGRQVARNIKVSIASLKIPVDIVYSSPYCRTMETAEIMFNGAIVDNDLAFSLSRSPEDSKRLGDYLKRKMEHEKLAAGNVVIIGHSSNLRDGLGVWVKPEGSAVVFKRAANSLEYLGMIKPDDWQ